MLCTCCTRKDCQNQSLKRPPDPLYLVHKKHWYQSPSQPFSTARQTHCGSLGKDKNASRPIVSPYALDIYSPYYGSHQFCPARENRRCPRTEAFYFDPQRLYPKCATNHRRKPEYHKSYKDRSQIPRHATLIANEPDSGVTALLHPKILARLTTCRTSSNRDFTCYKVNVATSQQQQPVRTAECDRSHL